MKKKTLQTLLLAGALTLTACFTGPAVEGRFVTNERSTGNVVDDSIIVSRVKSQLLADPEVSGLEINVDSYKGIVTLKGFVKNTHEANEAVRLAQNTPGVQEVRSKLVVE